MSKEMTVEQLNALQEHGVISDNCVTWEDVAKQDKEIARKWIEDHCRDIE